MLAACAHRSESKSELCSSMTLEWEVTRKQIRIFFPVVARELIYGRGSLPQCVSLIADNARTHGTKPESATVSTTLFIFSSNEKIHPLFTTPSEVPAGLFDLLLTWICKKGVFVWRGSLMLLTLLSLCVCVCVCAHASKRKQLCRGRQQPESMGIKMK